MSKHYIPKPTLRDPETGRELTVEQVLARNRTQSIREPKGIYERDLALMHECEESEE